LTSAEAVRERSWIFPILTARRLARALAAALALGLAGGLPTHGAADWPLWRGPTRTGHPSAEEAPLIALPDSPKVVWSVAAGPGYASPVVAGDLVFAAEAQEGKEVVRALDAAAGTER